jgi:ribonuclease HI
MIYYAVRVGRTHGIYNTWEECKAQINGFKKAKFKKFKKEGDAKDYMNGIEVETIGTKKRRLVEYIYYHSFPGFSRPTFEKANWRNYYYLFTDGSYRNRHDLQFKAGYGVYGFSSDIPNISKRNNETHNYCELTAIQKALKLILKIEEEDNFDGELNRKYIIVSDSQYCLRSTTIYLFNWILNDWKRDSGKDIHHLDVWIKIYKLLKKLNKKEILVGFMHVRSHAQKPSDINSFEFLLWFGNRCADKLAVGQIPPSLPFGFNPFLTYS